jgi:hypothetical protein
MSHSPHIYFLSTGLAPLTPSALFPNSHARFSSVFQVVPFARGSVMKLPGCSLEARASGKRVCLAAHSPSLSLSFLYSCTSSFPPSPYSPWKSDRHKEQYSSPIPVPISATCYILNTPSTFHGPPSFLSLRIPVGLLTSGMSTQTPSTPNALRRKDLGVAARR